MLQEFAVGAEVEVKVCGADCPESCTSCWDDAVVTQVNKSPAGDVTYDVCIDGKMHAKGYPGTALRTQQPEAEDELPEAGRVEWTAADTARARNIFFWQQHPVAHRTRQGLKRRPDQPGQD